MRDEPLAPACTKCEQVTGNTTCFPAPCVFFHERNTPGTKAHNVATLDRIRRGARERFYASADTHPQGGDSAQTEAPFMSGAVPSQTADAKPTLPQEMIMSEAENPPAFPSVCLNDPGHEASVPGMSLRDWFAGQALSSVMQDRAIWDSSPDEERWIAGRLYRWADAMLSARHPTQEQG